MREHGFAALYAEYIQWFRERAKEGVRPVEEETFPRFQSIHEDVYESGTILLNRMYYLVPLPPSQSLSGKMEIFSFSELNMAVLDQNGEPIEFRTVEYTRH